MQTRWKLMLLSPLIVYFSFLIAAGAETAETDVLADEALVFRGIAFERYRIPEILKELGVKKTADYTITNLTPALTPENQFRLDKLPPINPKKARKYIIMADFPLNTGVMPDIAQKSIIKDVRRGATLVILGGLFTLNKGEFSQTPFASLLPVKTENPWAVKKLENPLETPGGAVVYLHDIPLVDDAEIIYKSNNQPLWIAGKCEKGRIIVFLGIPSGTAGTATALFWKNPAWAKFAADMIKKGADAK